MRGTEHDGRVVLDDVNWVAISEKLGTRSPLQCLGKWYGKLSPSMVARGATLWSYPAMDPLYEP